MSDFPAGSFRIDGDASGISGSAGKWKSFAGQATDASGQITSLDTSLFVGPEGDDYRDGLNKDMPPHLKTTGDAYAKVSAALSTFSSSLSGLQDKMSPLASKAPGLWQAVQSAQSAYSQAQTDDAAHTKTRSAAELALKPGDDPLPADTYQAKSGGASSSLSSAQQQWNECLSSANGLKSDLSTAVDTCVKAIDSAKGMRFKENPGFWDIGGHIKNFISEHKDFLKKLSGVLKVVSAVAGVLSFIPVLAPILGPVALITGAAAFAIDVGIYAATGEGSLKSLVIDGALMLLPGVGKLATLARGAKGLKAAENLPSLALKYKKTWSTAQRAEADLKVSKLNNLGKDGKLVKTKPNRIKRDLRQAYAKHNGVKKSSLPKDKQVDHIHELQLGGADDVATNTHLLDSSVNQSVGAQIKNRIVDHQLGQKYGGVTIS